MLTIIVALLSVNPASANGYEVFYLNSKGAKIDAKEAVIGAVRGERTVKCQAVEAKVSDKGSIGLRNIKRQSN